MQSFVVTMLDRLTGEECRIVVQSSCPHGMQSFVDDLADQGRLSVDNPVVVDVDERSLRHMPAIDAAEH